MTLFSFAGCGSELLMKMVDGWVAAAGRLLLSVTRFVQWVDGELPGVTCAASWSLLTECCFFFATAERLLKRR